MIGQSPAAAANPPRWRAITAASVAVVALTLAVLVATGKLRREPAAAGAEGDTVMSDYNNAVM